MEKGKRLENEGSGNEASALKLLIGRLCSAPHPIFHRCHRFQKFQQIL